MSMLKSLKNKKDGKADPKKDKKDKEAKKEVKKEVKEEEEETGDPLVDMSEFDNSKEDSKVNKKVNKIMNSKLEEKQIDTSNIVVEKKEEKQEIKSWIVNEDDIKKTFTKKFDMNKEDTDFQSLTDQTFNKELEEKKKRQAQENKHKVVIEEKGGIKYAQLEKAPASTFVDINEGLNFSKKPAEPVSTGIPTSGISPPEIKFSNSKTGAFVPLEKTAQQLREEEMEKKAAEITIAPKKDTWLGKKTDPKTVEPQPQETKLSGWGALAVEAGDAPSLKFAPLKKTQIEKKYERQEQEFVFVSKKDMEERRKKREEEKPVQKS